MDNPLSSLADLVYNTSIALFKVFLTTSHPIVIVSLIKEEESEKKWRDGQWELQEIGKEYWYVGVRLDDSWRNGCFMIRVLFAWWVWLFGLVEWGGEGAARDCQEWRVKWMDLNSRRRDKYCMLCMECEEGGVDGGCVCAWFVFYGLRCFLCESIVRRVSALGLFWNDPFQTTHSKNWNHSHSLHTKRWTAVKGTTLEQTRNLFVQLCTCFFCVGVIFSVA